MEKRSKVFLRKGEPCRALPHLYGPLKLSFGQFLHVAVQFPEILPA